MMKTESFTYQEIKDAIDRLCALLPSGEFQQEDARALYESLFIVGQLCFDIAAAMHQGIPIDNGQWQHVKARLMEKFERLNA